MHSMDAPDELDDYRADAARALKLMDAMRPGYIKGKEYYDGTRAEVAASKVVESIINKSAQAHPVSLAHIPVDMVANKIELASIVAADASQTRALNVVFEENDLDDEFDDWLVKACYFGDYYAIIDPREEGDGGDATAEALRLVGSSPLTTIVVYDDSDGRTALYGLKRWRDDKGTWHARLYYDDVTVKLVAAGKVSELKGQDFQLDDGGEDGGERIDHVGGRRLVEHLAVGGKPYGIAVHVKAYGPQDAITKISATNLVNVDGQGFASRWALADPMAELDDDMDDDFGTDGNAAPTAARADGMTTATTGTSRVRSIPGSIALLKGITKVGQFDQTGSEDFLKNLDWYLRVMAVATGVPLFELDLKGDRPSGESLRRAEGRVNRTARKVQRAASVFLKNLGDTLLAVLGTTGVVTVAFYPLETSTDKDGLELVGLKVASGVPVRVALLEAGYTTQQVEEWWPKGVPAVTIDMLGVLGTALAQLGNAMTLGVITDAELADMLPMILTGARGEGIQPAAAPGIIADPATQLKAKTDAMAQLVASGVDPADAALAVGLDAAA